MAICASCGRNLSIGERLGRQAKCGDCLVRDTRAQSVALTKYNALLATLADPSQALDLVVVELPGLEAAADLSVTHRLRSRTTAVAGAVRAAIADGTFSPEEASRVATVAAGLGVDGAEVWRSDPELATDALIARTNGGWLTPIDDAPIILKGSEQAFLAVAAELMKEVVDREYQGGYRGVSFRVAKGVRVNAGGFRGHSVVTGTHIEAADEGQLVVTSTRTVFVGNRSTMELPFTKLISLEGFSDGVRFSMSSRVKAPLFRVPSGPLVIATVNALMATPAT